MAIRREIFVTQKKFDVGIDITCGSNLLPIELQVKDYEIPTEAMVVAYAKGRSGKLKKIVCDIGDGIISFIPTAEFFEPGKNELQIRVTYDNRTLFSYKCIVNGYDSFTDDNANEVEENSTLVEQLLTKIGELEEENSKNAANMEEYCKSYIEQEILGGVS